MVMCPHCFHPTPSDELPFRCVRMPPGGVGSCAPFDRPGRQRRVPCPSCGVPTSVRSCSRCYHELPGDYSAMLSVFVALVGPVNSGKTTFATVLLHELRDRIGASYKAVVNVMDDDTADQLDTLENALYERGELPSPTALEVQAVRTPMIFRFAAREPGRRRERASALVFIDSSGRDAADHAAATRSLGHLAHAQGIVLVFDPFEFPAFRAGSAETGDGSKNSGGMAPDQWVAMIAEQIRVGWNLAGDQLIDVPLAVCLSKADALWPQLPPGSALLKAAAHDGAFDEADAAEVADEVGALIYSWDGGALSRQLNAAFSRYSLFSFSALGGPPGEDALAPREGVHPVRVADPLLWLLSQVGLVPRRRGGPG